MEKRVSLEFYPSGSNGADGFQVNLEVWSGEQLLGTSTGQLAFPTEVLDCYTQWQQSYRDLGILNRGIKFKAIEIDGTLNQRKRRCQRLALDLQEALNRWLDTSSFLPLQTKWSAWITTSDQIRAIICTDFRLLWQLPWHQWKFLQAYHNIEISISRLDYEPPVTDRVKVHPAKIRILSILGNAAGINVEQDRQLLEQLPNAAVTFLVEPQRQQVQNFLMEQSWDILFFAGHSRTEGKTGSTGRIYLHEQDSLSLVELQRTLTHAVKRGLQLAIFNSCDGLGLVHELEQLHIPALIVMREPVPDSVAQIFLKHFLTTFAATTSLCQAMQQTRLQLEGLEDDFPCASWLPVMYQNPAVPPLQWLPSSTPLVDSRPSWNRLKQALGISFIVASIVAGVRWTGNLQPLELWGFDQLMRWKPEEPVDARLLVVEATEADIRQYGWPLSDALLAQLLAKLQQSQPRVIGLDILRDRPQEPGHAALMQQLKGNSRIITICKHSELNDSGTPPPDPVSPEQVGFNDVIADADDTVRRLLLLMEPTNRSDCATESAFSVVLAQKYLAGEQMQTGFSPEGFLQMGSVVFHPLEPNVGAYYKADLAGHQILMNYRRTRGTLADIAQRVSMTDVLTNQLSPDAVRERIVLIGITATSIKDDFKTPYPEKLRGLMLHTQMVSQLLSTVLEQRPFLRPLPWWGDLIWIGSWSCLAGILMVVLPCGQRLAVLVISVFVLTGLCFFIFINGVWLPWIPAGIALLGSGISVEILRVKQGTDI